MVWPSLWKHLWPDKKYLTPYEIQNTRASLPSEFEILVPAVPSRILQNCDLSRCKDVGLFSHHFASKGHAGPPYKSEYLKYLYY